MVKALVISFGAASLAALGFAGTRGGGGSGDGGCCAPGAAPAPAAAAKSCCASDAGCAMEPRAATIECTGSSCVVRYTTDDGRDGVIEIACEGDACRVVRCEPACGEACGK